MRHIGLVLWLVLSARAWATPLTVEGPRFVDEEGRQHILRGINVSGHAKLPPFRHDLSSSDFEKLASWGFNTIRLMWIWEAFEKSPGRYDWDYFEDFRHQIREAAKFGLFTIVDFHQDGFSRFSIDGCGDGFPEWALPSQILRKAPDNGVKCVSWGTKALFDRDMHRAWRAFYQNHLGIRDRFITMASVLAAGLRDEPLVIGYDLMNEPWGRPNELKAFWEDLGRSIRKEHPAAILFVSPHATTSSGLPSLDRRPALTGMVYSPHYYDPLIFASGGYWGAGLQIPFAQMQRKADAWGAPLFVGEFGVQPQVKRQDAYRRHIYEALDRLLASGAQWTYTPRWHPNTKDGWNREDFSITDEYGRLRGNFRPRPYPQVIPGRLTKLTVNERAKPSKPWLEIIWEHAPHLGELSVYMPASETIEWQVEEAVQCVRRPQALRCSGVAPGTHHLRVYRRGS